MSDRTRIAPSILSANFASLADEVALVESAGADLIHVDVMDGHFVPNINLGPVVVRALRPCTGLPLDVHLMILNPERYVDAFAAAGADILTVHVEACYHLHRVLGQIREAGMKAGLALNPHTPLSAIDEVLSDIDLLVLMSVNPGFGGQKFIQQSLGKLERAKRRLDMKNATHVEIEMDGGVKLENARQVAEAGADILVSGSGIFGTTDYAATLKEFKRICP